MIHSVTNHRKFHRLVRLVRPFCDGAPVTPESICVALLERLWHATIAHAMQGDIGRLTNIDIAEDIGWLGDADEIVELLVQSGWIDRCAKHRLVIHDWPTHAPNFVKGNIKRRKAAWAMCQEVTRQPTRQPAQGTVPGTVVPNVTKPNVTTPSTPTLSGAPTDVASTPSKDASNWVVVVEKLLEVGVAQAEPAIGVVKGHGCSPGDVLAVVEHFEAHKPAWEPGALHNRLLTLRPGQDASKHWPPPSAEYERQRSRAAEQNLAQKKADEQRKLDEQRAAEQERWQELEQRHGDALNFLDKQGVIDLLRQAVPDGADFHIARYRKSGLTDTLRGILLEYLESEDQE